MPATLTGDTLTRSVEDYLKAIFTLSPNGEQAASTSDIAHRLELSPPSVSAMVKRLSEVGLLEHVPYKGVLLTADGRRAALRMVRRHRLIEAYLVRFLGYSWDSVHDEAERLEHAVSDDLIERMAESLGHPHVDPHGDPIPAPDGTIDESPLTPLSELAVGDTVEVRRVATGDAELLRHLAAIGLTPGQAAKVSEIFPFGGPIEVVVDGSPRSLGSKAASVILCSKTGTP